MPTYHACIFCNRTDSRRTNEHIFADWIAKEFPNPTLTWETRDGEGNVLYKTKQNSIGFVSNRVCERCNTIWMRELEDAAKQILPPMIHGSRVTLSTRDQVSVVKWFLKVMFMCDAYRAKRPFLSVSERQSLIQNRRPANTWVFLACYRGPHISDLVARGGSYYKEGASLDGDNLSLEANGYSLTVLIKHLVIQVISVRTSEELKAGMRLALPGRWAPTTVAIPQTTSVIWPPSLVFDDIGFEEFTTRQKEMEILID